MLGKPKPQKGMSQKLETLIGPNTQVKGDLEFIGALLVEGQIEGNVSARNADKAVLRLGSTGTIRGQVTVSHMELDGEVQGDVSGTDYICLKENARITGNVYYALLEMAVGAEVNGNLVHRGGATPPPRHRAGEEAESE